MSKYFPHHVILKGDIYIGSFTRGAGAVKYYDLYLRQELFYMVRNERIGGSGNISPCRSITDPLNIAQDIWEKIYPMIQAAKDPSISPNAIRS